ncbi:MAG: hypothetical protein K2Q06_16850 [Parvularculaceae bacterium]|nr:hypothetical protein [Parvularculaceae bacterium]
MTVLRAWRVVFAALLVYVGYMSLTTNPSDTKSEIDIARWIAVALFGNPALADKVAHGVAYAALGLAAGGARLALLGRRSLSLAVVGAYGVAIEVLQHLGGVRVGDPLDAAANLGGAALGLGLYFAGARAVAMARPA